MTLAWAFVGVAWVGAYEVALFAWHRGDWAWYRRLCWWAAGALLVLATLPPVGTRAAHVVWVQALQFALLIFGAAPLSAFGAPVVAFRPAPAARVPKASRTRPSWARDVKLAPLRGWLGIFAFWVVMVGWRVPPAVDAVARQPAWVWLEVPSLLVGGWLLWSALVGSPPWLALHQRPRRMALAAVAMWSTWIFAYVVGFAPRPFYPAFAREPSPMSSQEIAVAVLWATSALAFVPVFFLNLTRWLRSEETPRRSSLWHALERRAAHPSLEGPGGS
jgi:cytochrome c oxidase assembly factor CtaG